MSYDPEYEKSLQEQMGFDHLESTATRIEQRHGDKIREWPVKKKPKHKYPSNYTPPKRKKRK